MHDHESIRAALRAKCGAEETFLFDTVTLVAKVESKIFFVIYRIVMRCAYRSASRLYVQA